MLRECIETVLQYYIPSQAMNYQPAAQAVLFTLIPKRLTYTQMTRVKNRPCQFNEFNV